MGGKRKISRPKVQARISVEELRNQFKRKVSLSQTSDSLDDPLAKAQDSQNKVRCETGIIYDENMITHKCEWDEKYPECPARFTEALKRCTERGLISRCTRLIQRMATEEEITSLHSNELYNKLKNTENNQNLTELESLSSQYEAIYIHPTSYNTALSAAGCAIELVDNVMSNTVQNGMAIIRPPGHHAMKEEFNGYCFFNNAALAAKYAVDKLSAKRVMIIDWDIHHGQGTQQMFYDDPRVLYFSIHRYENGTFWPWLRESDFDNVGERAGKGYNFNLPLNTTGLKNEDYLAIFHQIILPVAYEFGPNLILVSSGFDSACGDEKGLMEVTPAFYAHMLSSLMNVSGGRVALLLEGGYCLESLAEGTALTLRCLLGDPTPRLLDPIHTPNPILKESILNLIYAQRQYWKCLQYQETFCIEEMKTKDKDPKFYHIPSINYIGPSEDDIKHAKDTRDCFPVLEDEEKNAYEQKLLRLKEGTNLYVPPHKVCLSYDSQMEKHHPEVEPNEPERPARTREIMKKFKEFGLLDRVYQLKSRSAKRSEIEMVHSPILIDLMEKVEKLTTKERQDLAEEYTSTYYNVDTNRAAELAAGCLLEVVDSVCDGQSEKGVAVVRPPGHHAEIDKPYGFCFYNNVAVAAMYAIKKHRLKRILILDWDVHHGNGIQHIFESDPRVLYISVHMYKQANFFPFSTDANYDKVGFGEGEGFNVNIPWSKNKVGDAEYMAAMTQIILPISYQFDPDLVLISAGFDAAVNDPLGGCLVTPECFGHMAWMMSSLAGGKLIMTLEGGYNLESTSYSMTMCVKALLGDPMPPLKRNLVPSQHAIDSILQVIDVQSKYWSSLAFKVNLPIEDVLNQGLGGGKVRIEDEPNTTSESNNDIDSQDEFATPPETPSKHPQPKEENEFADCLEGAVGGAADNDNAFLLELISAQEFHAVVPLPWCPHLEQVNPLPSNGFDINTPCNVCQDTSENWICLTCYEVLCGRYVKKHMVQHGMEAEHNIVLSFSDLSIWCYSCESYVDHNIVFAAKDSAHMQKFGITIDTS